MEQKHLSVKEQVLTLLEENRGHDISGSAIAEFIGVSRNAVWKAIKSLQSSGYQIDAVPNRGYRLSLYNDILSAPGIAMYLKDEYKTFPIHIYKNVESTNTTVKHLALDNAPHGTIVLADSQTNGKGRSNRTFFSPEGSGIYLSILLKPDFGILKPTVIMTAACVAVCIAIEEVCHLQPEIKWINDLYLNGKKVCGILTDAIVNFEAMQLDSLILGIGINFVSPENGFPPELETSVSALGDKAPSALNGISRNQLTAEIINQIMHIFSELPSKNYLDEYRKRSFLFGKQISIFQNDETISAKAVNIDDDGGLVVLLKDRTIKTLYNSNISIRIKENC